VLDPGFVRVCALVSLAGTAAVLVSGMAARRAGPGPVLVVAKRRLAPGTQFLWVGTTGVVVFWSLAFLLAPGFAYHWPSLPTSPYSSAAQVGGAVLGTLGGVLYFRAARAMGRQMTPVIQIQRDHRLLQSGPYRYIRHPIYTAILAVAVGQTLFYLSPLVGVLTLLLVGLAFYRTGVEEELLSSPEGFGSEYVAYRGRTGRFLPPLHPGA
jgi:protein-S-isoprenylcysteine O-methyltransferase Ste14